MKKNDMSTGARDSAKVELFEERLRRIAAQGAENEEDGHLNTNGDPDQRERHPDDI